MKPGCVKTQVAPTPSFRAIERQLDRTGDSLVLYHGFTPNEAIVFLHEACLALMAANNELLRIVQSHDRILTDLCHDRA